MPVNIEVKARVADFDSLRKRAEALSDTPCQVIPQVDSFFNCPDGRLKLRQLSPGHGQLVFYHRPDVSGPKHSEYHIFETDKPRDLQDILTMAFGVRGVVSKVRYLYLTGQTRIHLDDVEGLGYFMELEVVLKHGQSDNEGQAIARQLMEKLAIEEKDLIDGAYIDLLET